MGLIGADIDQLRATIATMRQGSATLQESLQRAMQAMQAMQSGPWAGQHRQQAEAVWERIVSQLQGRLNELDNLTARTERFANNLEGVGRQFRNGAGISAGVAPAPAPAPTPAPAAPTPTPPPANGIPLPPYRPFERGATTNPGALARTAGCTNYVLRQINLNDMGQWPHAHAWNEAAQDAGYVVDSRPAAGAVMVFEGNGNTGRRFGTDPQYGHVALVEQVERAPDGTVNVTISEASVAYNPDGSVKWGEHTKPSTRVIKFKVAEDGSITTPDGKSLNEVGVSFILGRKG